MYKCQHAIHEVSIYVWAYSPGPPENVCLCDGQMPRDSTRELLYIFNNKALLSHNKLEAEPCRVSLWHNDGIRNPGASHVPSASISLSVVFPHSCSCARLHSCPGPRLQWKKILILWRGCFGPPR